LAGLIQQFEMTHLEFLARSDAADTGGLVILIVENLIDNSDTSHLITCPGRFACADVKEHDTELHLYNVRNYGLTRAAKRRLLKHIEERKARADNEPLRVLVMIGGEFIFPVQGGLAEQNDSNAHNKGEAAFWKPTFSNFTEFAQQSCARFGGWKTPTLPRIDRIRTSAPALGA
jgi:hypothetical protein